jgi:hypothetical protein
LVNVVEDVPYLKNGGKKYESPLYERGEEGEHSSRLLTGSLNMV